MLSISFYSSCDILKKKKRYIIIMIIINILCCFLGGESFLNDHSVYLLGVTLQVKP